MFLLLSFAMVINAYAQNYNQQKNALVNFLVRMYKAEPFEGIKVVADYENNYLLSVVLVAKTGLTEAAMNRIAQVKNQRQTSQYLGGSVQISSETIIRTAENSKQEKSIEEIIDVIKENSVGFTKAMEILTTFDTPNNQKCYMFYRRIEEMKE